MISYGVNIKQKILPTCNSLYVDDFVRKSLPDAHGKVLNVGSGTRSYRSHLPADSDLVTVDIQLFNDTDIQTSVYQLPFNDEAFDVVIATELLEHLQNPYAALREINRVLCSSGKLIMTVPFLFRIHGDPDDFHRYTSEGLSSMVEGLFVGDIQPYGNKMTVIMDILSTSGHKWSFGKSLRCFNRIIFPLLVKSANPHFPSGYKALLQKKQPCQ